QYLFAFAVFCVVSWGFLFLRDFLIRRLKVLAEKTITKLDDLAVELLAKIRMPECFLIGFYVATRPLFVPPGLEHFLRSAVIITVAYRVVTMVLVIVGYSVRQ